MFERKERKSELEQPHLARTQDCLATAGDLRATSALILSWRSAAATSKFPQAQMLTLWLIERLHGDRLGGTEAISPVPAPVVAPRPSQRRPEV